MDNKVTELEDDCLISELIDHFVDSLKIAKFFICKDEKGALVLDDNKSLNECNLKHGDTLYCYKEPKGQQKSLPLVQSNLKNDRQQNIPQVDEETEIQIEINFQNQLKQKLQVSLGVTIEDLIEAIGKQIDKSQTIQAKFSTLTQIFLQKDFQKTLLELGIKSNCALDITYITNQSNPAVIQPAQIAKQQSQPEVEVDDDTEIEMTIRLEGQQKSKMQISLGVTLEELLEAIEKYIDRSQQIQAKFSSLSQIFIQKDFEKSLLELGIRSTCLLDLNYVKNNPIQQKKNFVVNASSDSQENSSHLQQQNSKQPPVFGAQNNQQPPFAQSPFGAQNNQQPPVFGAQNNQQPPFAQSPFGAQNNQQPPVFGAQNNQQPPFAQSPFGVQNNQQPPVFGAQNNQQPPFPPSPFGVQNNQQPPVFGAQNNQQSPFAQSPFAVQNNQQPPVFGAQNNQQPPYAQSPFGVQNNQQSQQPPSFAQNNQQQQQNQEQRNMSTNSQSQQNRLNTIPEETKRNFDFYFNNYLMNKTQTAIISKNEYYVTFYTHDQLIKFVLFQKDAEKEIDEVSIPEDEIDIYHKYRETTVVFLKNQLGCVVYWNNDKVTKRIIKLNQ